MNHCCTIHLYLLAAQLVYYTRVYASHCHTEYRPVVVESCLYIFLSSSLR